MYVSESVMLHSFVYKTCVTKEETISCVYGYIVKKMISTVRYIRAYLNIPLEFPINVYLL